MMVKELGVLQATKVGPTIAEDIKTNSYWAVLGSLFSRVFILIN
jgi:SecD/SecF fusion protein